jgi:N-acetylmuramoyl-L-alanine amidase
VRQGSTGFRSLDRPFRRKAPAFLLGLLLAALTVTAPAVTAAAAAPVADPITLIINGRVAPTDAPPILAGGTTLVPIRVVSETLGAAVAWSPATATATITSGQTRIHLTIGAGQALLDGRVVALAMPARLVSGRTMVPIRFVSEALGAEVSWDQARRQVIIVRGSALPSIENLSWQQTAGLARFVIVTNGPAPYRVSTLARGEVRPDRPDRLVVDVAWASVNIPATTPVDEAGIQRVRTYTEEIAGTPTARVVFDTDEPLRYEVWATWDPSPPLGLGDLPAEFKPGQQAIVVEIQYKVLSVEFVDDPGAERVIIHMNGPADYRVWEAAEPWRLVVDARRATLTQTLAGLSSEQRTTAVGKLGVSQVRIGQFNTDPDTARIVLDADSGQPFAYNVTQDGNDLVVNLGGAQTITGFGYDRLDTGGRLTVWANRPLKPTITRTANPDCLVVEFKGARLGGAVAGGGVVEYGDDLVLKVAYAEDLVRQVTTFTVTLRRPVSAEATPMTEGVALDIGRSALLGKRIVIDPGHGGTDPGAIGPNGVREADLTPLMAAALAELLRAAGAEVILTRTTSDENPDKYARPELANSVGADAFVSLHLNANYRPAICGTETYFYHQGSRLLCELVLSRLLDQLGRPDGGVRWADFVVTREAHVPACLVEGLYMTNSIDFALIMKTDTLDRMAQAIFEGLEDFFAGRSA